jgi:pseudaminic acid synthase
MTTMQLGRPVGSSHPPFIIAALDCSGLSNIDSVLAAIDAAADASCDGVKLVTLPWDWYPALFARAEKRGLFVLSSVGDERSIQRLDWLGTSAFELFYDWSDLDLVTAAARTGKPLVLSVANASPTHLADVISHALREGAPSVALVQRVAGYALGGLEALRSHGVVVGVSYRPVDSGLVRTAIARGARIVEVRMAPQRLPELARVVRDGELAWAMLGNVEDRWTTN